MDRPLWLPTKHCSYQGAALGRGCDGTHNWIVEQGVSYACTGSGTQHSRKDTCGTPCSVPRNGSASCTGRLRTVSRACNRSSFYAELSHQDRSLIHGYNALHTQAPNALRPLQAILGRDASAIANKHSPPSRAPVHATLHAATPTAADQQCELSLNVIIGQEHSQPTGQHTPQSSSQHHMQPNQPLQNCPPTLPPDVSCVQPEDLNTPHQPPFSMHDPSQIQNHPISLADECDADSAKHSPTSPTYLSQHLPRFSSACPASTHPEHSSDDARFMSMALHEAHKAFKHQEVPVGAVLVVGGQVVSRAHNLTEALCNPVCHAEMLVIIKSCAEMQAWRLLDATLYVTVEPCPMCAGAILNARIKRLVYGARQPRVGADGSWVSLLPQPDTPESAGVAQGCDDDSPMPLPTADTACVKPHRPHPYHPKLEVQRGVLEAECQAVMRAFFKRRRERAVKDELYAPSSSSEEEP